MNVLAPVNPVTRIIGIALATTPLLLSIDWLSATIAIILSCIAAPICGVRFGYLIRRSIPLLIITPLTGISMLLYARPGGKEYFSFLSMHITDNSIALSIAIMLRVLAFGLPVVVLSARIDPTDLGDGLAQILHLPARFIIAAVSATRLISLVSDDAASIRRARRSRGVAQQNKIRTALGMSFSVLVSALRRGAKLSTAMEARGFGRTDIKRTWARPARLHTRDFIVLIACILMPVIALVSAYYAGTFSFLGMS
ncbi:energy-coupling factor transporter transmembrane protein EcfT [Corynebacterium sp. sy039]|uniref:energy-coupling factor transporter transmembrane component T family protein n=1 Tax=Corynebacterium sp. sy039 TaxID=2599641 RepID=UPI0011B6479B|nr:energy-coupling factor transporter transmembrane component T [Corynebacterium sp. sy039]QDZ43085.1 energy-coupling factor transporter transmembrane protein EcfT [Corynebacterium sp. sy039]